MPLLFTSRPLPWRFQYIILPGKLNAFALLRGAVQSKKSSNSLLFELFTLKTLSILEQFQRKKI
jgi:hypothetical protein